MDPDVRLITIHKVQHLRHPYFGGQQYLNVQTFCKANYRVCKDTAIVTLKDEDEAEAKK